MPLRGPLKYEPLRRYLAGQPPDVTELTLTFAEFEAILGCSLPASARLTTFWANRRSLWGAPPAARAWMAAGWRVERTQLPESVTFVRVA